MKANTVCLDIHAVGSIEDPPVYRLYVDNLLMTERTYTVDNFSGLFIREICPYICQDNTTIIKLQWIVEPFQYSIENVFFSNDINFSKTEHKEKLFTTMEIKIADF